MNDWNDQAEPVQVLGPSESNRQLVRRTSDLGSQGFPEPVRLSKQQVQASRRVCQVECDRNDKPLIPENLRVIRDPGGLAVCPGSFPCRNYPLHGLFSRHDLTIYNIKEYVESTQF
jgi:hypothetical protein